MHILFNFHNVRISLCSFFLNVKFIRFFSFHCLILVNIFFLNWFEKNQKLNCVCWQHVRLCSYINVVKIHEEQRTLTKIDGFFGAVLWISPEATNLRNKNPTRHIFRQIAVYYMKYMCLFFVCSLNESKYFIVKLVRMPWNKYDQIKFVALNNG